MRRASTTVPLRSCVTSDDFAQSEGLTVLGRIRSWASIGVTPDRTGLAPTVAIPKALERAGMKIGDIDLFEINEAFCSMAVACTRSLGIEHDIVNVNGSGCGLGHPVAATGTRMAITMLNELRRRGAERRLHLHVCRWRHGRRHGPRDRLNQSAP